MTVLILTLVIVSLGACLFFQNRYIRRQRRMLGELTKWHKMALTDNLTGIPNRAAYSTYIKTITDESVNCDFTCAVLLFDIDNFKLINDTYGHPAGDKVLQNCASLLRNVFLNPSCSIYRIGGDEFAVIVRDMSEQFIIDRLLEIGERENKIGFRLSKGYYFSDKKHNFDIMIKNADEMLYADKASKKNKKL